ncbi:hypothetical protein SAMN02745119_00990 [Trichlorobacter thiogenes]|uniref:Uncharacterized protein n=2 Tax=Trichlorobacter thiogenes TaxID=115783 RepID=A0A1T4LPQ5_9BACT|nr:hypothetical protein SAMN02745119_00990 [Trichlorobacter thiogenes]
MIAKEVGMSQEAVEQFFGRLVTDDRFRRRAMVAFEDLLLEEGFQLSKKEQQAIKLEDLIRLEMVSAKLDTTLKRFSG